jgi:hypothetical protein
MTADPNKVAEIIDLDEHGGRTATLREEHEHEVRTNFDTAWAIANDDPWEAVSKYLSETERDRDSQFHKALGLALGWRAALERALSEARKTADELQLAVDNAKSHVHEEHVHAEHDHEEHVHDEHGPEEHSHEEHSHEGSEYGS